MGGVLAHATQQVGHVLTHVVLRVIETREQLRNDTCAWVRGGRGRELNKYFKGQLDPNLSMVWLGLL